MKPLTNFDPAAAQPVPPGWLTFLLAGACGLLAANLYYAQPLAALIGSDIGLPLAMTGIIVTMTQLGYGIGLLLVVPLGDLLENRALIVAVVLLGAAALVGAALSHDPSQFLAAAVLIGIGSVSVQIIVPYSAHLVPEQSRGRMVGNVMGGLMFGIMAARPMASFVTAASSWHVIFFASAVVMIILTVTLRLLLPQHKPLSRLSYGALLASMARLAVTTPTLRRRALYQAAMFGAFSLFWTVTPLWLAGPEFHLTQVGIALFALAGVAGAVAAPIAGRVADRGWTRGATIFAMVVGAAAFAITHIGAPGSTVSLGCLVAAAVLLDFGVQANVVVGQRVLFSLGAEYRSRLNGLYIATFFVAGAVCSAVGAWAYVHGGWLLASAIGFTLPVVSLVYSLTEPRHEPVKAP